MSQNVLKAYTSVEFRHLKHYYWFRYGIVLQKLADEENAPNAFHASISIGSGKGGKFSPI